MIATSPAPHLRGECDRLNDWHHCTDGVFKLHGELNDFQKRAGRFTIIPPSRQIVDEFIRDELPGLLALAATDDWAWTDPRTIAAEIAKMRDGVFLKEGRRQNRSKNTTEAQAIEPWREWVAANAPAYHYGYDHRGEYEYCGNNICVEARALLAGTS